MFIKWIFDRLFALIGLLFLWPVLLVVAIMVKIKMPGGPAFFVQKRVGRGGRLFTCHKFRSMTVKHSGSSVSVAGDSRITPFGAKLRHYKIDELPELWDVLIGNMSFVGPRPCSPRELDSYTEKDKLRLSVPQGLTGEWQTHGRSNTTFEERIDMDLDYIQNKRGFFYDLYLIFKTVGVALRREGAE